MRLPFDARYLVLGVLLYIIVLILSFPADRAYAYWKNSEAGKKHPVSLVGISGSAWSGNAELGVIQGQSLENIQWNLRPWVLLLGQVGLSWSFSLPGSGTGQGFGHGITSMGMDGSMEFPELEARLPVAMLASMARLNALRPSGSISLNLQDVEWNGQSLESVEGRMVWHGAGVNLIKPVDLGDLAMNLETEGDTVKGVISDSGGPLSIAAVLTLNADGVYQVTGMLAARNDPSGDITLQNALRSMGRPGPDGKVKINYSGNLAKLGL